jgi:2-polyprenyl-3-methyl-5-hydroxy-6-metoxy-1,4-benzoquinol methylase
MSSRGSPAPKLYRPADYWEDRARRFASDGAGLAAVCSYGMPEFYNRYIQLSQRLALAPWLRGRRGMRVLDVGCGVGRWSRLMASRGAIVTGVDLSPTMIAEAKRRARERHVLHRCWFEVQDTAVLDAGKGFDLVLGVTVLQHILDPRALRSAVRRMADHLRPGGRMVLLEAAPARITECCNTTVFEARARDEYLRLFAECGLRCRALTGVDPAPFKTWLLPRLRRLPSPLSVAALAIATALSLAIDIPFGRLAARLSWHAVFVLEREEEKRHEH